MDRALVLDSGEGVVAESIRAPSSERFGRVLR